ncbi:MAG TPA: hypothetical protein VFK04_18010 [Gemmatimonadaceae bacterium]|nr:hypothetical protein [Gemmatimonadaceae bacterium]
MAEAEEGAAVIRTAADATRCKGRPELPTPAPAAFSGSLDELCSLHVLPNLPQPAIVAAYHHQLVAYLHELDPLLLIRHVRATERRTEYVTDEGVRFIATDNAPAWWTHAVLLQGCSIAPGAFRDVVRTMPTHMFDAPRGLKTANRAGWHIAHILDVKDRNTAFATWDRADAIGRFVRSVHPCNYFLLPKAGWRHQGGDRRVLAYFARLYSTRYREVWTEFLALARKNPPRVDMSAEAIPYSYDALDGRPGAGPRSEAGRGRRGAHTAGYTSARLLFRASVIEPLEPNDLFCVTTSDGTFSMTKADFYRVFENVSRSRSYVEHGCYHYPTIPQKAEQFRLPLDESEDIPETS